MTASDAQTANRLDGYVMIVDDDHDICEAMTIVLDVHGYRVETFQDGHIALERLRSGSAPYLILLDLMMPRMTGVEFREQQLRDPALAAIPVVVLSGDATIATKAAAMKVECLTKPVSFDKLLETVSRFRGAAGTR